MLYADHFFHSFIVKTYLETGMQKLVFVYSLKCKNLEEFGFYLGEVFWLKTTTGDLEKQVLD